MEKRLRHHESPSACWRAADVPDDEQAVANGSVVPTTVEEMPRSLSARSDSPLRRSRGGRPGPAHGAHTDESWPSSATAQPRSIAARDGAVT